MQSAEVTQNLNLSENFKPDKTANFAPAELVNALERNIE